MSFCFLNWSLGSKVFVLFPFLCIVFALLTVGYISVNKKASLVTGVMPTATRGTGKRRKIITTCRSPPYHIIKPEEQTSGWKNLKLSFAVVAQVKKPLRAGERGSRDRPCPSAGPQGLTGRQLSGSPRPLPQALLAGHAASSGAVPSGSEGGSSQAPEGKETFFQACKPPDILLAKISPSALSGVDGWVFKSLKVAQGDYL